MSPLKKAKSLYESCQIAVKNLLVDAIWVIQEEDENEEDGKSFETDEKRTTTRLQPNDDDESMRMAELRSWMLDWLMPDLAAQILHLVLSDQTLTPDVRINAFKTLFSQHSKCLNFAGGSYHDSYHHDIASHLIKVTSASPRIEDLSTRGVWFSMVDGEGFRDKFYEALRQMNRLKQLKTPYIANDQLLRIVAANCPHMTILDLSGARELTDTGVSKWVQHVTQTAARKTSSVSMVKSLQCMNLGGPGGNPLKPSTVAEILYAFPNLVTLGGYPFMGQVLDHLQYEIDGYYQTKLKYFHDRNTSSDTLDLMAYCCPDLIHVFLDTPQREVVKGLFGGGGSKAGTPATPDLRKLKLSKVNCDDLNEVFDLAGGGGGVSLTSLEIVNGRGSLDLTQVAKACHNLQSLEIYYSMAVHVSRPLDLNFPALKRLSVYSTDVRGNYSQSILKSCRQVEKLTLCNCDTLNDDQFFEVLESNPLDKCTSICLLLAPYLTVRTIWTIMTCCENVSFIGKLDTWDVNYAEVEEIRSDVKHANLNLELWETFDSFDRAEAIEDFIRINRQPRNHGADLIQ